MAEPFVETIYAMIGVFAIATAVFFSIRGGRYARGYQKEIQEEKTT